MNAETTWEHRVLESLVGVAQDPIWHAEGDVATHTKLVGQAMRQGEGFSALPEHEQDMLYKATVLHDMAKPVCTQIEGGRIRSHGHAKRGSIMARTLLYQEGVDPQVRERICSLIRWHMVPVNTLNEMPMVARMKMLRANLGNPSSWQLRHSKADMAGRITTDPNDTAPLQIEAFEEMVDDLGCKDGVFPWPSPNSRFEFFYGGGSRDPRYQAYDSTEAELVVMAGLPGSGKDTWVKKNLPNWPMVSLDDIRNEIGAESGTDQGPVIIVAKEAFKTHLRKKESFVFNATNLVYDLRQMWVGLAAKYGFRVRYVYLEVPYKTLWERNRTRPEEKRVPDAAINKMLDKWEPPDESEAHVVERVMTP